MTHFTDRPTWKSSLLLGAALCVLLASCGGPQSSAPPAAEQRYALKGTVISIDRPEQRIVVDHEEIKGFMAAMAMPYPVTDPKLLDTAAPGDQITADVVVTAKSAHLENIVVVKKAEPKPGGALQQKMPGVMPPNSEMAGHDGRQMQDTSTAWKAADTVADLIQFGGCWS